MKNLKRALSLVLSTAMLAGMMMVGTGAAFDDVTAEHNEEAIAVVSAAGIMGANEEFNPDAKITRNEMAVVMCNMLDLNTEDYTGASNFADVPAWAEGYVDACYANGIVSGVSATQYNGSANVTTGEAALMMMKALGYFQFSVDFENDWLMATIKQASKIELLEDVDAGAKAAMTRNEVAQLALNALESIVVEGEQSGATTNITAGDVQIEVVGKTTYTKQENLYNYGHSTPVVNGSAVNYEYLIEKLYEDDFTKTGYTTDLEQPGHVWKDTTKKLDEQKIISVADEAKHVVVVDDADLNGASVTAVYNEYIDEDATAEDIYGTDAAGVAKAPVVRENGSSTVAVNVGDVVEYYTNDDNEVTKVIVIDYKIGEIEKVSTKGLTKEEVKDGATAKITVEGVARYVTDNNFAGFDYEEEDIVLYVDRVINGVQYIVASKLPETIEGKVTSLKSGDAKINGEYHASAVAVAIGAEGTFYLGEAGEILLADTTSASEDYIYIYSLDVDSTGMNADGIATTVVTAYTVDTEGTKGKYDLAIDVVATAETEGLMRQPGTYFEDTTDLIATGVYAYSVNSDDQLVKENAKDAINGGALSVNKDAANGTSGATEFIFAYRDGSSQKVATATGYKNVKFAAVDANEDGELDANAWTITNVDGDILYVFVAAKNGSIATDANLAVVTDAAFDKGENEDGDDTYTYAVVIDGEESALTFKSNMGFYDGQVIAYEFEGDWAVIDTDVRVQNDSNVLKATDDYIVLAAYDELTSTVVNTQFNLTGDEVMYTITKVYDDADGDNNPEAGELEEILVSEGADVEGRTATEAGSNVYFVIDDDAIDTLFVVEKAW